MKAKFIRWLALVLSSALSVFSTSAANTNSLRVVVIPSTNEVRVQEYFKVALRVENPTKTNQTVYVWTASWDDHWKSSNTNVSWLGWDAAANLAINEEIPAGGAYTNELQMVILHPVSEKRLSFRMGFTPFHSKTTFWSDKVKLRVLPPDAWQRGAFIYRDRNHDGKIDWEVSGRTWADGGVDTYKVDTNYDGFYDLKYGAGGTNGRIQWITNIHESVPKIGKDLVPREKEAWMYWWEP